MSGLTLADPYYRWLDRLTKLGGVGLVAAGLEVGGSTGPGLALGLAGAVLAVSTVFINHQ